MNKKKGLMFAFGILMAVLSISLISAVYYGGFYNARQGMNDMINLFVDFFEPLFQVLLGGVYYSGWLLFERFLIFILLLSIVYVSISRTGFFGDNKAVTWIISVAVPLLAVRFISFEWLNTIILQYQVLGVALTSIIPFLIYLFFLHGISNSPTVRKIGWIFFIVVYFGLWTTSETKVYGEVYLWTALLSLLFLLFDGTIHYYFMKQQLTMRGEGDKWARIAALRNDIRETKLAMDRGDLPEKTGRKILKDKEKAIERWMKY